MTLQELKQIEQPTISVPVAATIMGVTPLFLRLALQQGRFAFGTAVKMKKQWAYYINRTRFIQYLEGGEENERYREA